MARNGAGSYSLPSGNPVVTGTTISSTDFNNTMSDLATAMTGSVAADGQTPMTGNLPMGNNRIAQLANAATSTDAVPLGQVQTLVAATMVAGTAVSGNGLTAIDFSSIPAGTRRVTLQISSLSTSGTSIPVIQIGDGVGGLSSSGYVGAGATHTTATTPTIVRSTSYWPVVGSMPAASTISGAIILTLVDTSPITWVCSGSGAFSSADQTFNCGGAKALVAALDRLRLTTAGASDTFNASGARVNILYE